MNVFRNSYFDTGECLLSGCVSLGGYSKLWSERTGEIEICGVSARRDTELSILLIVARTCYYPDTVIPRGQYPPRHQK